MANSFELHIKTSADLKSVQQLKQELQEVKKLANEGYGTGEDISKIQSTIKSANTLEHAIQAAFDPKIETINIEKFNKILKDSGTNVGEISHNLLNAGAAGQQAFLTMSNSLTSMGNATKQTNKVIERMATTFKNTVSWGISSGLWNEAVNTAQQAYGYVKSLDSSLNDIRIVTGKSADEMQRFGTTANETAKQLGVATSDFTEGALIYFQQGLDEETSTKLAEVTAKAANVTGQSMKATSEELTAVWNGYNVAAENAEQSVDKLAAVAASSASDLQELATGMSKVASAANAMGVGEDQLAAQLSTIISVTRQAPESVGTALKTIYARMTSIQAGTDEEGVSLGQYTEKMAQMGINVLDANNKLRDMGEVIEEVGGKWSNMSREQQVALAQTMAGTRQYNNLIALFDNFDQYNEMVDVAANSTGTLEEQQAIYLESITAKTEKLKTTFEDLYDSLFDEDSIKDTLDAVTGLVQLVADLTDSIGGLKNILPIVGALGVKVFKDQIGEGIGNVIGNAKTSKETVRENQAKQQNILLGLKGTDEYKKLPALSQQMYEDNLDLVEKINDLNISLSKEQLDQIDYIKDQKIEMAKLAVSVKDINDDLSESKQNYTDLENFSLNSLDSFDKIQDAWQENNTLIEKFKNSLEAISYIDIDFEKVDTKKFSYKEGSDNYNVLYKATSDKHGNDFVDTIQNGQKSLENAKSVKELNVAYKEVKESINQLIRQSGKLSSDEKIAVDAAIDDLESLKNELEKNFKNIEDFKEQLDLYAVLKDDEEAVDKLVSRFKDLTIDKGFSANQALKIMQDELVQAGVDAEELKKKFQEMADIQANQSENDNFLKGLDTQEAISNITNLISSVGELYTGLRAITNLGSIWSDTDLSTGEKLEQTFMNLAVVIPILANATKVLSKFSKEHILAKSLETLATKENTEEENKNTVSKNLNTEATKKNAAASSEEASSEVAEAGAEAMETAAETGKQVAETTGTASKGLTLLGEGIGGIASKIGSLATKLGPVGIAVAAITTAVAIGAIAWGKYKEKLKETAEEASKTASLTQENADAAQEEVTQINSLSNSYNDLLKQYKEGAITKEELQEQGYSLLSQYGLENEALNLMAGNYDKVTKAIREQRAEKARQSAEEAKNNIDAQKRKILTDTNSKIGIGQKFFNSPGITKVDESKNELRLRGTMSKDDIEALQTLKNYNLVKEKQSGDYRNIDNSEFAIDADKLNSILSSNDAQKFLDDIKGSDSEIYKAISQYVSNQSESFKEIKESNEEFKEDIASSILLEQDTSNIKTTADALKIKQDIEQQGKKQGIYDGQTEEEISSSILSTLGEDENLTSFIPKLEIAQQIADQFYDGTQQGLEEAASQVDDWSESEILFIKTQVDTNDSVKSLDELKNKYSDALKLFKNTDDIKDIESVLKEVADKGSFSDKNIEALFGNEDFANKMKEIGTTQEEFTRTSYQDQLLIVQDYYNKVNDYVDQNADKVKAGLAKQRQEISETFTEEGGAGTLSELFDFGEDGSIDTTTASYQEAIDFMKEQYIQLRDYIVNNPITFVDPESGKDQEATFEQIQKAFEDYSDADGDIAKVEDKTSKAIIESNKKLAERGKQMVTAANKGQDYKDSIDNIVALENKAQKATGSYTASIQAQKSAMSKISSELKTMTSDYNTLNDIVDEYNKNGYISMDNLESILTMDDSYLATLQMQNGQLSLNGDAFDALAEAKLQEARASAISLAQDELKALAAGETSKAVVSSSKAMALAVQYAGDMAANAATGFDKLWASASRGIDLSGADPGKVAEIENALKNRLSLIDSVSMNTGKSMKNGSGSGSKKDSKELNKEKVDKYKQLELAIDRTNDALGRLQDREDHLSGKDLIKNLEAQTKQYVKQAAALTRLSKAASKTAANLKKQGSIYKNISYDKEGNITQSSYEAEFAAQQKAYNDAIKKYNASAKEEADEKALEKAEEAWNNFKDWVDDYDEACQKVDDTLAQLMQNIQDTADANLKKFDITFDVKLNTEELNRSWSDFQKKYQKDFKKLAKATLKDIQDISSSAESYNRDYNTEEDRFYKIKKQADLMNKVYGQYADKNGNISADKVEAVTKALKQQGVQYTSMADLQKDLEESFKALQDSAESVFDSLTEAWDTYLDSIDDIIVGYDDIQEEFQEQIEDTEYYCELIESMARVYDDSNSVYEQTTAAQISMNATKMEVTKNQIAASKDELATLKEMQDTMQEGDEDWEKLDKQINKVKKSIKEQAKAYLEAAKAKKELEDEKAYKDAEKAMTGGITFSERKNAWDQAMADQDRYYDSTERLYQLQSMAGKYDTAINNKGYSLKTQKQLNDLKAKELDYLKKKEKMSKDDIEMAEKRYQIAIAQADLENAQNNKNSMKVTRNAQGNWTYQYVADDEDVEEKQQALSDAYNDLYVTAREAYQNAVQLAMEAQQEYLEKLQEINENTELTAEQRQQKLAELEKEYSDRISIYMNDASVATENMMGASTTIIKDYFDKNQGELKTATDEMQKLYNGVRDAGVDSFQKIFEKAQNISDPLTQLMIDYSEISVGGFLSIEQQQNLSAKNMAAVSTSLLNTLKQNDDNYAKAVEETLKMLGLQYKDLGTQITDNGKKSQESYQKQQQYSQKAKSDIAKEKAEIEKLTKIWNNLKNRIEKCKTALDALSASTVKGIQQITAAQIAADKQKQQAENALRASSAASSGGAAASQKTWELQSSTGGLYRVINKATRKQVMIGTKEAIKNKGYDSSNTEGLKTGGYTGEWDNGSNEDNGKLAFLHQKELVLNEKDTVNFLDAINTVRDITSLSSSIGDTIISSIAAMLTKALTGIGGQTPIYNNDNTKDDHSTIVYNVEADFSGVSSKEEIIAAFKELPNLASQYVNEKHR